MEYLACFVEAVTCMVIALGITTITLKILERYER